MEKSNTTKSCENCAYGNMQYVPGQITQLLSCMRYPPQMMANGNNIMSMHPPVQPESSCGEFRAKVPVLASVQ